MTGVGDILWAARRAARRARVLKPAADLFAVVETVLCALLPARLATWISVRLLPDWWRHELRAAASPWWSVPRQHIPDGRDTLRLMKEQREGDGNPTTTTTSSAPVFLGSTSSSAVIPPRRSPRDDVTKKESEHKMRASSWALLLPLTSRQAANDAVDGDFEQALWRRLEDNLRRLAATTSTSSSSARARVTTVYVAVDLRDPVFDTIVARRRIESMLHPFDGVVFIEPLTPAYQGNLCWIWALMARRAVVEDGNDFFILLGDDVEMLHDDWQTDVEECFEDVATKRNIPYGCACVALRDSTFECFPTFPVMHRFHLEAFRGELFPVQFRNQHGDPFLFEIYRRWGASRFTKRSGVRNAVGGAGTARYAKAANLVWRGDILTRAIDRVANHLRDVIGEEAARASRVPCFDVVVPTFRCDVDMLRALSQLECG